MIQRTNFKELRLSRKKPAAGDIFAMHLPNELYLFGRVVLADLPYAQAPMPGANLLYIYRDTAETKDPKLELMTPDRLLIPPIFTNRQAWLKGYFETLGNHPLHPDDLLRQHCFLDALTGKYVDEKEKRLPGPVEPCGDWGLFSYLLIDREISERFGFPPPIP